VRKHIINAMTIGLVITGALAVPATAAVPQAQQSHFAALRHAPASEVPKDVKGFLQYDSAKKMGVDPEQTRRVPAPGGGSAYVTPGEIGICLYVESEQTGTCAPTADALAGRLSMEFVEPDSGDDVPIDTPRRKVGLLPDGAVKATGSARMSGPTVARPSADGLYRLSGTGIFVGNVTMHRAGKRPLLITAANKWPSTAKARKSNWCQPNGYCGMDYIPPGRNGWAYYGGLYGWTATITRVLIYSLDSNTICGNAKGANGGAWAGAFFCTNSQFGDYRNYDAAHRAGWAGPGGASASVYGVAAEQYFSLG
jgi:hypothetical protein